MLFSRIPFSLVMLITALVAASYGRAAAQADPAESAGDGRESLNLLFLGDNGHHRPAQRFSELAPALAERNIQFEYTEDVGAALQLGRLQQYDGLILYANIDRIEQDQADALLQYVSSGGGFVPLHCASFCFRNDERIVALIGAQFLRHGTGVFTVAETEAGEAHPILQNYDSFESWDETYVHTKHNERSRTVLQVRVDAEGPEPWTWVRTRGNGRVFYTAWGHDQRTFTNPGFVNLVERGIRWACGGDPTVVADFQGVRKAPLEEVTMTEKPSDLEPFEYVNVGPKIPNYAVSTKWGVQDEPMNLMQKPLSPEESLKHYVVPEGFKLNLFASEPEIGGKPVCMAWDIQGRLWIAETVDYPNEKQPEGAGRDRIRICEDADGDGNADKFTVFADGLSIPTSLAFSHGGVIVHQAPDTLFLKDTDGDDQADSRKVLFTGWATNDTHAGPSNLNYGIDNWFYGIVGYAGFEGEIAGESQSFRTGFYRFRVDEVDGEVEVTDFEFLRNTDNNSWGVGISEEGLLFGSTANRNPSEFMPIANRYYERVRGWTSNVLRGIADDHLFEPITDKIRQVDHHGGYTAAAGHALYTARNYPQAYWNRTAFVAGPTGHLVGTFILEPDGAGFTSHSPFNLMASDDEWASPIMAEVGPDGNVWVIDWYNYIVQHNPTPIGFETGKGNAYLTDLRDKTHGRIYRILHSSGPTENANDIESLAGATDDQLVDALSSSNFFWRRHAQRLLVERDQTDMVDELKRLVARQQLDAIGLDVAAIHALWTLDGLGAISMPESGSLLRQALQHPSNAVVRAAIKVLPQNQQGRQLLLESEVFQSDNAQVRLAALLALADMPASKESASRAIEALTSAENQDDRWMLDAATSAAATSAADFLAGMAQQQVTSSRVLEVVAIVAEHIARSEDQQSVVRVLTSLTGAQPAVSEAVIAGLAAGWPSDQPLPLNASAEQALVEVFEALPVAAKGQLISLAETWGSETLAANAAKIAATLLEVVEDEDAQSSDRVEAAVQLIGLMSRSADAAEDLLDVISPRTPQSTAIGIVNALRGSRSETIGDVILSHLSRFAPAVREAALRVMVARPETTRDLLDALEDREVAREDLTLDQQQALLEHPNRSIRENAQRVLAASGGLPSPDRAKVLALLMDTTKQTGNVARGKQVFMKNCANCHTHSGEGTKVGPDLTGMAVHPKEELLIHILDPSRSVEGNYRSYSVLTLDGFVLTGMLASETQTAIELYDAQGKSHVVLREDIDELIASDKSIMPEGFEKQIDEQGFADLLEFLTDKGKFLPLPLNEAATAVSTKGLFSNSDNGPDRLVFDDWSVKMSGGVPFLLVDPRGQQVRNIILLHGPNGTLPPQMPKSVKLTCNAPAEKIHLLSGISGWGYPFSEEESVSMIVRLHYADGSTEDHPLRNGVHFADYIRRVDVPGSEFAFDLNGQQLRRLSVEPKSDQTIEAIEFVKGNDATAPMVMAVTVEGPTAEPSGHETL